MVNLSGEERFSEEPEEIWRRLTDTRFLARILPGMVDVERAEPGMLTCRVQPKLAFLKGTLKISLEMSELAAPTSARMRIHSKAVGSTSVLEAMVELSPTDPGTRVVWSAEITELGGLLKMVSRDLIVAAAGRVISDAWTGFRSKLDQ